MNSSGAVVVRVQDRCGGLVDLDPAGLQQIDAEGLVLGVGDLAKADLLPAGAGVAGVDVREERGVAGALHPRLPAGREPREELGELAGDHRARVGSRQVRPVGGADALFKRERGAVGRGPAGDRGGVLGEEADELAAWCARAPRLRVRPWPNSAGSISSSSTPAARAISRERSREPESITSTSSTCSRASASSSSAQVALAVLDGNHDRDRGYDGVLAHGSSRRLARRIARLTARIPRSAPRSSAAPGRRISALRSRCQRSSQ